MNGMCRRDILKALGVIAQAAGGWPSGATPVLEPSCREEFPAMLLAFLAKQLDTLAAKWNGLGDPTKATAAGASAGVRCLASPRHRTARIMFGLTWQNTRPQSKVG